jgi:serine/threonine protein kinase
MQFDPSTGDNTSMPVLVMEHLGGGDLNRGSSKLHELRSQGTITETQLKGTLQYLARELLDGMEHLQSKGIVHNDLKLDNVLIDGKTLRPKISDFGTGTAPGVPPGVPNDTTGTPESTAPEVDPNQTETRSHKSDMFSLGCAFHKLFQGEPGSRDVERWHNEGKHTRPLLQGNTDYDQFINGLTHLDPNQRFTVEQARNHPWLKTSLLEDRVAQEILGRILPPEEHED